MVVLLDQFAHRFSPPRRSLLQPLPLPRVPRQPLPWQPLPRPVLAPVTWSRLHPQVVDGHVITVNDTVVGGDDGEDSLIHIRVIDVHPSESPEAAAEGAGSTSSAGSAGSSAGAKDDADKTDKGAESLGSEEVTSKPNRAENEIPMKVGSEVDDLNA